jgi:hypothetical protein
MLRGASPRSSLVEYDGGFGAIASEAYIRTEN